jgi:hypothetical protein
MVFIFFLKNILRRNMEIFFKKQKAQLIFFYVKLDRMRRNGFTSQEKSMGLSRNGVALGGAVA